MHFIAFQKLNMKILIFSLWEAHCYYCLHCLDVLNDILYVHTHRHQIHIVL